jgi:hypothetical protein
MKGASGTGMSLIIIANGMLHPSYIYHECLGQQSVNFHDFAITMV